MRVELTDEYFMNVGPDSFDLCKHSPTKKQPDNTVTLAYCTHVDRVIKRLLHILLSKKKETVDVKTFIQEWRKLQSEIELKIDEAMNTPNATR